MARNGRENTDAAPDAAPSVESAPKPKPAKTPRKAKKAAKAIESPAVPVMAAKTGGVFHALAQMRHDPDAVRRAFETGAYPYKTKMKRRAYEKHKAELQVELLKLQKWVQETGERFVVIFEGRDAAGKGGTIKRFMEHLNPRGARAYMPSNRSVLR